MGAMRRLRPLSVMLALLWSSQLVGAEKARISPELVSDDFGFSSSAATALDEDASADQEAGGTGKREGQPGGAKGKRERTGGRDPVAVAFALPRGAVLNDKQREAFDKLRADYEPRLRDALDRREEAGQPSEKLKAAREVTQIRAKITAAINQILDAPRAAAEAKAREDYAKWAAEMKVRAGQMQQQMQQMQAEKARRDAEARRRFEEELRRLNSGRR